MRTRTVAALLCATIVLTACGPKVETRTEVREETVSFNTVEEPDPSRLVGARKVTQRGREGTNRVTYEIRVVDGVPSGEAQTSSEVATPVVDEIVKVGSNGGCIVYVQDRSELWRMATDGSNRKKLLDTDNGSIEEVAYSARGGWLAVQHAYLFSGYYLSLVNARTGKVIELPDGHTNGGQSPQFSPDGKYLYYRGDEFGLYRYNIDKRTEKRITGHDYLGTVVVSPNGKKVAFTFADGLEPRGVCVANANGSKASAQKDFDWVPWAFNPEGSLLYAGQWGEATALDVSGGNKLSNQRAVDLPPRPIHIFPGRAAGFSVQQADNSVTCSAFELGEMSYTSLTSLGPVEGEDPWMRWDGMAMAYASDSEGNSSIYVMDDGGSVTQITNDLGDETKPIWVPIAIEPK